MLKLAILLICLTTVLNYCPGTYTAPFLACTFNYEYQDQNCTEFVLDNCTWIQCVAYTVIDNVTYCTQYQTLSLTSWSQCTAQCCISSKTYPQTYDSLEQCEADVKKRTILIIIIVTSVIGGIAVIIIIICCAKKYLAKHPNIARMEWLFYLLACRCFTYRRRQNIQQVQIQMNNDQNGQPYSQIPQNKICVICIQKGLIPYQTPFLVSQREPYICDSCKPSMEL